MLGPWGSSCPTPTTGPLVPPFESDPRLKGQPPKPNAAAAWGCRGRVLQTLPLPQVPRHDIQQGITGKEPPETWCVSVFFSCVFGLLRKQGLASFRICSNNAKHCSKIREITDYRHRGPSWAFPPHYSRGVDSGWCESPLERATINKDQ